MRQGPSEDQPKDAKFRAKQLLRKCAPDVLGEKVTAVAKEANQVAGILNSLLDADNGDRWPAKFGYKLGEPVMLVGKTAGDRIIRATRAIGLPSTPREFLEIFERFLAEGKLPEATAGSATTANATASTASPGSATTPESSRSGPNRQQSSLEREITAATTITELAALARGIEESFRDPSGLFLRPWGIQLLERINERKSAIFSASVEGAKTIESLDQLKVQVTKAFLDSSGIFVMPRGTALLNKIEDKKFGIFSNRIDSTSSTEGLLSLSQTISKAFLESSGLFVTSYGRRLLDAAEQKMADILSKSIENAKSVPQLQQLDNAVQRIFRDSSGIFLTPRGNALAQKIRARERALR